VIKQELEVAPQTHHFKELVTKPFAFGQEISQNFQKSTRIPKIGVIEKWQDFFRICV